MNEQEVGLEKKMLLVSSLGNLSIGIVGLVFAVMSTSQAIMLDGIFIGATATSTMRNMMLISLVGYFLAWAILMPTLQNHGLWLSLHILFLLRAVTLGWALPGLDSRFRSEEEPS